MKNISLLFILFISIFCQAQNIELGTKWCYGYSNIAYGGYMTVEVDYAEQNDSGFYYRLLHINHDFVINQNGELIPTEIQQNYFARHIIVSNGTIYWYHENKFLPIYKLNPNLNETFQLEHPEQSACGNKSSFSITTIDTFQAGSVKIPSYFLERIAPQVSFQNGFPDSSSFYYNSNFYLPYIGSLNGFFPNYSECNMQAHFNNYTLRSFESPGFSYQFTPEVCEYELTLNIQQLEKLNTAFEIFPHPVSNTLNINWKDNNIHQIDLQIFDLSGRMVFSQNMVSKLQPISISLESGLYQIVLIDENGAISSEKLMVAKR